MADKVTYRQERLWHSRSWKSEKFRRELMIGMYFLISIITYEYSYKVQTYELFFTISLILMMWNLLYMVAHIIFGFIEKVEVKTTVKDD